MKFIAHLKEKGFDVLIFDTVSCVMFFGEVNEWP